MLRKKSWDFQEAIRNIDEFMALGVIDGPNRRSEVKVSALMRARPLSEYITILPYRYIAMSHHMYIEMQYLNGLPLRALPQKLRSPILSRTTSPNRHKLVKGILRG